MSLLYKIVGLVLLSGTIVQANVKPSTEINEGSLSDSCRITNMEEISFRCLGNEHYLTFDLQRENEGEEFSVFRNSVFNKTFRYDNLPVEAGPFTAPSGSVGTLSFHDKSYLYCVYSQEYTAPNCIGCEIENIIYIIQNCQNGQYFVNINFDHTNTNDFFTIAIDDSILDTFSYDALPITLGPFLDSKSEYEIEIRDVLQQNCTVTFDVISPMCTPIECELTNISILQTACLDEQYNLIIDFDYAGQSNRFEFWLDGEFIGEYTYNSLPLNYGPIFTPADLMHTIQVVDVEEQDCFTGGMIEVEDCTGVCELSDMELEQVECEEGEYYIRIDISREFSSDEAIIYVDGNLIATRLYADFPLNVGPFQSAGESSREVRVVDSEDGMCFIEESLDVIDCRPDCALSAPEVNILPCEETQFNILLNFEYADANEEFFVIDFSGNSYGTFAYEDLPIEIGPFEGDASTEYILSVFDENQECDLIFSFTAADCKPNSTTEKLVENLKIFPNPASRHFSLSGLNQGKLTLTDVNGKTIKSWTSAQDSYSLEGIAAGIYILTWQNNGEVKVGRLIVNE